MKCILLRYLHKTFELKSKRSSLIKKKTDWSESKKETKLVALEDKMKKRGTNCTR